MTQQSKLESDDKQLGIECDVDSCEETILALDDGWEYNRGTVCSGCIEYQNRHHHWPDEEPDHCRECVFDDGGELHDCPETTIDVLLRPGDDCPECNAQPLREVGE